MLYLDTSSFLKLLLVEPETEAVLEGVSREEIVVFSSLTELESESRLRAALLGGDLTRREHERTLARMQVVIECAPFERRSLAGTVFATALDQARRTPKVHCRSLDRLHFAAMDECGIKRLMTHDLPQRKAALALGYEVLTPE